MNIKSPYTLVVIDMQPYFTAARGKRILANCQKEIQTARKLNNYILFVEYENCGRTDQRLIDLVNGYHKTLTVVKNDDDGSWELQKALRYLQQHKKPLKVCGVNTDMCVYDTVYGLLKVMPWIKIKVVEDACDSYQDHMYGLTLLKKLNNVMKFEEEAA